MGVAILEEFTLSHQVLAQLQDCRRVDTHHADIAPRGQAGGGRCQAFRQDDRAAQRCIHHGHAFGVFYQVNDLGLEWSLGGGLDGQVDLTGSSLHGAGEDLQERGQESSSCQR